MVVHIMPYQILACSLSDVGLVRQNNEDVCGEIPETKFFILADGMGGHQAGEIAARQAVSAIFRIIKEKEVPGMSLSDEYRLVRQAIEYANHFVHKLSRSSEELKGMGTTICCLKFHEQDLIYAHVGDSRIYRLRDRHLDQLTKDHSLLSDLIDLGQLSEDQVTDFAYKNIITKAIGTESMVEPSVYTTHFEIGDIYMMCSDGLSDLLSKKEIESIMNTSSSLEQTTQNLVNRAKERGGHDNVTVVLVQVKEEIEAKEDNEAKDLPR